MLVAIPYFAFFALHRYQILGWLQLSGQFLSEPHSGERGYKVEPPFLAVTENWSLTSIAKAYELLAPSPSSGLLLITRLPLEFAQDFTLRSSTRTCPDERIHVL